MAEVMRQPDKAGKLLAIGIDIMDLLDGKEELIFLSCLPTFNPCVAID